LLLGGFHIHNAEESKYQVIADYLHEYLPQKIGVCHCTGVDKYASSGEIRASRIHKGVIA